MYRGQMNNEHVTQTSIYFHKYYKHMRNVTMFTLYPRNGQEDFPEISGTLGLPMITFMSLKLWLLKKKNDISSYGYVSKPWQSN